MTICDTCKEYQPITDKRALAKGSKGKRCKLGWSYHKYKCKCYTPEQVKYKGEKWRGECIRCRNIWYSETESKKCPKCGFDRMIMKEELKKDGVP
jgi:Zn finger protein HypA/HybF involved in hydrogenase expression